MSKKRRVESFTFQPSFAVIYAIGLSLMLLDPLASVYEALDPRRNLVGLAIGGIVTTLPGEDRALGVRHHCQVAAVGRTYTGYRPG